MLPEAVGKRVWALEVTSQARHVEAGLQGLEEAAAPAADWMFRRQGVHVRIDTWSWISFICPLFGLGGTCTLGKTRTKQGNKPNLFRILQ